MKIPFILAILSLTVVPARAQTALFADAFGVPDALISNEYAYWNPAAPGAVLSPAWSVTSGSLFASGQRAWTGVPDAVAPNAGSSNGTNSAIFRVMSKRADFGSVAVAFSLLNQGVTSTASTPAVAWDGVHIWLRYQSDASLYAVSVNRRDNKVVIKKKVPGGATNGGTYYDLSPYAAFSVPYNAWQNVKATALNNADGSVTLELYVNGARLLSVVDNGSVGGPAIAAAGRVGVRGDNCDLKFDDFAVTALSAADATAPTVAMTSPVSGATVAGAVSVSASASDNVGVVGVQFTLDGVNLGSEATTAPYTIPWNSGAAANGAHALAAVARDAAGNRATSAAITVAVSNSTVDTTPPKISGVAASNLTAGGAAVSWTTDEAADSQVEYGPSTAYGTLGALDATLGTAHSQALGGLAASTVYHYRVRSRDAAGNLALSPDFSLTTAAPPDTTAPTVAVTAPASGAVVSGAASVSAAAFDGVGVVGVQFKLDGASLGAEVMAAPYSVPWNSLSAANGAHALTASARDAAGNRTESAPVSVTVNNPILDAAAPTVSFLSPAANSTVSGVVSIQAAASDNVGVAGVQFQLDGANLGPELTAAPYAYAWSAGAARRGAHRLTAVARDAAGNRTSVTIKVNVGGAGA